MDVRNCKNCGKIFNYVSGISVCPTCQKQIEDKFQEVKAYIEENPGASITQVSTDTDVTVQQIKRWVREERLSFADTSVVGIECENCGRMIKTGRFCQDCKEKIHSTFQEVIRKPEPVTQKKEREQARMRFLDGKR